jgi:hypothetical protein
MYGDPLRVVSSASTLDLDVQVEPPPPETLPRFTGDDRLELAGALGLDDDAAQRLVINGTRLLVYRYDPGQRLDPAVARQPGGQVLRGSLPILPLPPVPDGIEPGATTWSVRSCSRWLYPTGASCTGAFIEPATGAVLYLRAFVASATACVFVTDPITATGNAVDACSQAADLDPLRTTGTLQGLDPPNAAGNQGLADEFVVLTDTDPLTIAPPTTTPFSFCYSAVIDDFTAASAYHHYDAAYRTLQGMGFVMPTTSTAPPSRSRSTIRASAIR